MRLEKFFVLLCLLALSLTMGCAKPAQEEKKEENTPELQGDEAPETKGEGEETKEAPKETPPEKKLAPEEKAAPKPQPEPAPEKTSGIDLEALSKSLPANTSLMLIAEPTGDPLESFLSPELIEWWIGGERWKKLQADLDDLFNDRFGLNPMKIQWVALVATESEWVGVVFGGEGLVAPSLPREEDQGLTLVTAKTGLKLVELKALNGYALSTMSLEPFRAALTGKGSLHGSPAFAAMSPSLKSPGELRFVGLLDKAPLQDVIKEASAAMKGLSGLRTLSLTIHGREFFASIEGDAASIQALKAAYEVAWSSARTAIAEAKTNLQDLPFEEKLAVIAGSHLMEGHQLSLPVFSENSVSLKFELDGLSGSVGIIGVLSAVAVPAFLKYIKRAKEAEAYENLKSIGDGAVTYFQEEHLSPDGMQVLTRQFPVAEEAICTAPYNLDGSKLTLAQTTSESWDFFDKQLRFVISKPHFYQYCYTSDGKTFKVTGKASLGGSGDADSAFLLEGETDRLTGAPFVHKIVEVNP